MCRMLIAIGSINVNQLIDGILLMAKDQNSSHEHNQKKLGRWKHEDGWGAAYLENDNWKIVKSTKSIAKDLELEKLRTVKTNLLLIHARKKTKGSRTINECHPFLNKERKLIFSHNGTINGKIPYNQIFKPKGTTDSERLFFNILTSLKKDNFKIVTPKINSLNIPSGTNLFLSSPKTSIIGINYKKYPKYYRMALLKSNDSVIVSSEKLSNIKKRWKLLDHGNLIKIDHKTLRITELND